MDREQYITPIQKNFDVRWVCPTCGLGFLRLIPITFEQIETAESRQIPQLYPDEWEFDWLSYIFTLKLECNNTDCGEDVIVIGKTGWSVFDHDDMGGPDIALIPLYVYPAVSLINLPRNSPPEIFATIDDAFKLYWPDKGACANKIRIAIEQILDDKKIKKKAKNRKGKLYPLSLNGRIEALSEKAKKYSLISDYFHAVRWIGNYGSHDEVSEKDTLLAFEFLEIILNELYGMSADELSKIARKIKKTRKLPGK